MGKSSDEIRQGIDQQRADAGQKINQLERQVQEQAEQTRDQVMHTAEQVRDEAQEFVHDTVETVRESFNIQEQVQERPLVAAGAALIGGFLLGSMMGDSGQGNRSGYYSSGSDTTGGGHSVGGQSGGGLSSGLRSAAQKSGLEDTISNAAAALMGSLTEQLKNTFDSQLPGYAEKMETAQQSSGSFSDKAKATQQEAQRR